MSELTIKLETVDPVEFFGFNNNKLKILKKEFNRLNISARGNKIIVAGAQEDLEIFNEKVHQLVEYLERYGKISDQHLEEILHGRNPYETNFPQFQDNVLVYGNNGMLVRARTENQQKMVELSEENDILFAL
ncbi:MAG TPA: phosphate starvation-inducible protein PhoH, partial [Chitinophagales bacterium]|nr:phosphate starvation-inducible protein PhoH [Chitinophagales bacterium]